ncbi:MAG: hypothetical protein KF689_05675 [Gemmatimonadaceae bacterium]|nr:hypothetical protein [Gemmatimonadaceae bacterium]MCW5825337.1 hypothetical protein [Gemmatimonadaceae bacterium]
METLCIEMAPFTLAPGTSEDQLLAASDRLEREFLATADGYLGRALSRLPDGRWTDVVLWRSREAAYAAMGRVHGSEACNAYFGCMVAEHAGAPENGVTLLAAARTFGVLRGL